jgi:hypothetical protein
MKITDLMKRRFIKTRQISFSIIYPDNMNSSKFNMSMEAEKDIVEEFMRKIF